jgi:hypothetical protein
VLSPPKRARCDGRRITSGLAQQSDKLGVGRHFAKVHKSSLLTAQYLPLALDNALKRMTMFAGKRDHLRRLGLSYFVRVSPETQPVPRGLAAGLIASLSNFIGSSLTSVCLSCFSSTGGAEGRYSMALL